MKISIGTRIRELRTIANMSQEELGRRVGVQRAAINKYERDVVTNIPITTIEKIARVFDVSPQYIVGWNGDESNPLSAEVKVIQGVKKFFGPDALEVLEIYQSLNNIGKKRIYIYSVDMEKLYKKE